MGMTIDEHIAQLKKLKSFHNGSYGASINFAIDTMRKYQMMQADYNARLKADMAAMLEDLKKEIEEIPNSYEHKPIGTYDYCLGAEHERKVNLEIIQQKIDSLKGGEDGNE